MITKSKTALILSLAVVTTTASAGAQQHEHTEQAEQESLAMASHMMVFMPQRVLGMADILDLSDAQSSRLDELADAPMHARASMEGAMGHRESACEILSGDSPDWAAYTEMMQTMAATMVSGHVAMMRTAVEARSVLTPDQVEQVLQGAVTDGMHGGGEAHAQGAPAGRAMDPSGMMGSEMIDGGMMQMMQMMSGACTGHSG